MNQDEALLLSAIAEGATSIEEICFSTKKEQQELDRLLADFLNKQLVFKKSSLFFISKQGLLQLSRHKFNVACEKDEFTYLYNNDLPYLPYINKFDRDTIVCPDLYLEFVYAEETDKPIFYEVDLANHVIDMDLLECLSNLLYELDVQHLFGFWILHCADKSVCGYSIQALRLTESMLVDHRSFVFIIGFQNFIIVAKSTDSKIENIKLKIYITRGVFPYVDTLDWLFNSLKIFWRFIGFTKIPTGKEIQLKSKPIAFLKKPLRFVPTVWGKIYWTNRGTYDCTFTQTMAIDSRKLNVNLSKVTPWFAKCAGGILEEDFDQKRAFSFFRYEIIKFPEVNVISFVLHAR